MLVMLTMTMMATLNGKKSIIEYDDQNEYCNVNSTGSMTALHVSDCEGARFGNCISSCCSNKNVRRNTKTTNTVNEEQKTIPQCAEAMAHKVCCARQ
jgi:hypothetical protein